MSELFFPHLPVSREKGLLAAVRVRHPLTATERDFLWH
ncbi:MAG: hypothetical protein AVDCRST_MAG86-2830 [uncultured Truepera sp.]|uniref:Uncharacterized protein n=1 Tax=uncultured Truepera sp. TaxID=543023 RepID=A0A6J4VRM4_9DEIN|nr:MAG: hypothetical protein AVDCRST_MAG86-2830 [uncultured Truepera sp.]